MELIIGGTGQGKLDYALSQSGCQGTPEQLVDDGVLTGKPILNHFHLLCRRLLQDGKAVMPVAEELARREIVIVCDEIGCGVEPIDAFERRWREETGRACCYLAKKAERVVRLYCGVPEVLKPLRTEAVAAFEEEAQRYLQGDSCTAYRFLGAQPMGAAQAGIRFTVYAPAAKQVGLIGSFNGWRPQPMKRLPTGFWVLESASARVGDLYKYRITTAQGESFDRADPMAFYAEKRPNTASSIYLLSQYVWQDQAWRSAHKDIGAKGFDRPLSIYEVHAGSWRIHGERGGERFYTYAELADTLLPYAKENGFTHIEFLPLAEHPLDASWGYQMSSCFSPTSRYGEPAGLMYFVDRCHQEGIGVILDFVPAHFIPDFYALQQFDGSCLYESEQADARYSEWGTVYFDFTKPHVVSYVKSALDFWLAVYHFDGIRYDAVSNLLYVKGREELGRNEAGIWFLKNTNYQLQQRHPGAMLIAEDSSLFAKVTAPVAYGGLGFDYKWDLGWMNETLRYLALSPARRERERALFEHAMRYFYQDIFLLPFSHDEVVHGKKTIIDKMYGSYDEKFAQLRTLYLYQYTRPGKKLNFMGNELAEFREWDAEKELGWNLTDYPAHQCFTRFFSALQHCYLEQPALYRGDYDARSFAWQEQPEAVGPRACVFQYRRGAGEMALQVGLNFSAQEQWLTLPARPSGYEVILYTEAAVFGGGCPDVKALAPEPVRGQAGCRVRIAAYSGILLKAKEAPGGEGGHASEAGKAR